MPMPVGRRIRRTTDWPWSSTRPRRGRERCIGVDQILTSLVLASRMPMLCAAELQHVDVVVLVGRHPVAADDLAAGDLGDADVLPLPGLDIEPVVGCASLCRVIQTLPSTFMWVGVTMLVCVVRSEPFLVERIGVTCLVLRSILTRRPGTTCRSRDCRPDRARGRANPSAGRRAAAGAGDPSTLPVFGSSSPTSDRRSRCTRRARRRSSDHVMRHALPCAADRIR